MIANHVSHLEHTPDDQLNRLLSVVIDIENLYLFVHKEEDTDTKQVYFYLFKVSKLYEIKSATFGYSHLTKK